MKITKKALILTLCVVLIATMGIFGTMAYLTDDATAVNTFTVGKIEIDLDEAEVDEYGIPVIKEGATAAERVKENNYKLIPGHEYVKDPTVTVLAGSEESYVRMLVTFSYSSELDAIFDPDPQNPSKADLTSIFGGYDGDNWQLADVTENEKDNTRTYEFRYVGEEHKGTKVGTVKNTDADIKLDALFDQFTVPDFITGDQLATLVTINEENGEVTNQFKISVVAHAIQADGFADANEAWANF